MALPPSLKKPGCALFDAWSSLGAGGMSAGAIGEALGGGSASRLSFHLSHLEHSGLVESRRKGRSIIYSAIFPALSELVAFLMRDCCEGHCDVCDRAISLFAQCTGRPVTSALSVTFTIGLR